MYEYLIGTAIMCVVWLVFIYYKRQALRPSIWTGVVCTATNILLALSWLILSQFIYLGEPFIPNYWDPPTLFNLGRILGMLSVEDIIFTFFAGALASVTFFVFKKGKIRKPNIPYKLLAAFVLSFLLLSYLLRNHNLIYSLILASIIGGTVILVKRPDLKLEIFKGSVLFLFVYFISFIIFTLIFPNFISEVYKLHNISGSLILTVPLEELLFAFSVAFMFGPLYEYAGGKQKKKQNN